MSETMMLEAARCTEIEIWPMMKIEHKSMLERTEIQMVRWMCGSSSREKKTSSELKDSMDTATIGIVLIVLMKNNLRRYDHMEKNGNEDRVAKCRYMLDSARLRGKPRKTWLEVMRSDMSGIHRRSACGWSGLSCYGEEDCEKHLDPCLS